MPTGTVKWFNQAKGYGFIEPDGGGADIFVHVSQVQASGIAPLTEGARLQFELIPGPDGRHMAGDLAPSEG